MKLKHYQEKALTALKDYLEALNEAKAEYRDFLALKPSLAKHFDFPAEAWQKVTGKIYHSKTNSIGERLPDVYLKIPTGGGKTFLACHSIDLIQKTYLQKQNGLVLWIVPSTQIYRQTLNALKDRAHPYRQLLDISTGGRTLIKEKGEKFTRQDTEESLILLLLMLPSANRQNKETLKVFRDAGGFADFFPPEDNYAAQKELLTKIPNLDHYGAADEVFQRQIKTSLGNALRVIKPLIIIDEGHKAYSEGARATINNFNPSFVLELSATPPKGSNLLVQIGGRELHEEEMIKLDIHLVNKTNSTWQDTLLTSLEKLKNLNQQAIEYRANTGQYIRPAMLIQVERTGKDQQQKGFIHAEQVKEYLIKNCAVAENEIAIKSSEKDDIEGIDLFADDCNIRYIITKQALQEGWDFSFAYVLTILTNPASATGITQLVGRILRQPYAQKTKIAALDECYIYTFQPNAGKLVQEIKYGLQEEGLEDIAGRIMSDEEVTSGTVKKQLSEFRPNFKRFEGRIILPRFIIQEENSWRELNFEADILQSIDFEHLELSSVTDIILNRNQKIGETDFVIGYAEGGFDTIQMLAQQSTHGNLKVEEGMLAQQLSSLIPNPWIAFEKSKEALQILQAKYNDSTDDDLIPSNFVFIISELKKIISKQIDTLAEQVFKDLIDSKKLAFFLTEERGSYSLPSRIEVKGYKRLTTDEGLPLQKSLFDPVYAEEFNEMEASVAIYLDKQEKLLFWYRNRAKQDYHIQGWRKNKIYPDFIAADKDPVLQEEYDKVFVLETKGIHLKGNDDTRYKQNVFELCNQLGARRNWKELSDEFPGHNVEFQVVFQDEWQNEINRIFT